VTIAGLESVAIAPDMQRAQLLSRVEGSRRKLANADFLRKASAEVVQKERDRLAEGEAQIENVEATLAALG
jgi:valyl-tRNA synthetase